MKSALELAMERAAAALGGENIQLTDEQKAQIDQVRKVYEAKWAEQEIALQGRLQKVAREATDAQALQEARNQVQAELARLRQQLDAERDAKIAGIRKGGDA
ncbi:MAG: hypothetical protein AB1505_03230 [Candidatus Latescibacterota bacterium]